VVDVAVDKMHLASLIMLSIFQNAYADPGTFANPGSIARPYFRYWLPDASVNPEVVKSDIENAGAIGAGGVELLPFYNYGGSLGGPPSGVDWSEYGFGSPAFVKLFKAAIEAHRESNLKMDFALGPNQGQGVPANPNDEGLQWDLVRDLQIRFSHPSLDLSF
jgi:hypothetical protein